MKKQIVKAFALMLISSALLTNCKKAEAGPKGDTGATGATGAAGNANVKTTQITLAPSSWYFNASHTYAYTDILWTAITSDIQNTGLVLVYGDMGGGAWQPLPLTFYNSSNQALYDFTYNIGSVTIGFGYSDHTTLSTVTGASRFKIVAIAASNIIKNINHNNYNDVVKAYGLKD